ncbi:hypothetical protein CEXT_598841 [Caerostris extrusa]|uniref:Uncharacterized protein n=1 Tax=Caerostris extrusa TaxID=172846 RepID=A0AAV4QWK1_CAEEX|nr:hypothetical protein CEXT_598841 [Caerostris extrusa]
MTLLAQMICSRLLGSEQFWILGGVEMNGLQTICGGIDFLMINRMNLWPAPRLAFCFSAGVAFISKGSSYYFSQGFSSGWQLPSWIARVIRSRRHWIS